MSVSLLAQKLQRLLRGRVPRHRRVHGKVYIAAGSEECEIFKAGIERVWRDIEVAVRDLKL